MKIIHSTLFRYLPPLMVAACVPGVFNPTVSVMPGPGKSLEAFATEQTACKQFAEQQITAAQAATAVLQQQYDVTYSQCMYAKGNQVPGYAAASPVPAMRSRRVRHLRTHRPAGRPAQQGEPAFVEPAPTVQPAAEPAPAVR